MNSLFSYEDEFDYSLDISFNSPVTSEYSESSDIDEEEIIDFGSSGSGHSVEVQTNPKSPQEPLTQISNTNVHDLANLRNALDSQQNSGDGFLDYVIDFDSESREEVPPNIKLVDEGWDTSSGPSHRGPHIYNTPLENLHPHYSAPLLPSLEPHTSSSSHRSSQGLQTRRFTAYTALSSRYVRKYDSYSPAYSPYSDTQQRHNNSMTHRTITADVHPQENTSTSYRAFAGSYDPSHAVDAYSTTVAAMIDKVMTVVGTAGMDARAHNSDALYAEAEEMDAVIDFNENECAHMADDAAWAPHHTRWIGDSYRVDNSPRSPYSHHYTCDDVLSQKLAPGNMDSRKISSQSMNSHQVQSRPLRSRPLLLRRRNMATHARAQDAHGLAGANTVSGDEAAIAAAITRSACAAGVTVTDGALIVGVDAAAEVSDASNASEDSSRRLGNDPHSHPHRASTLTSLQLNSAQRRVNTYANTRSLSHLHARAPMWRGSVQLWAPATPADIFTVRERAQALAALLAATVADSGGGHGDGGVEVENGSGVGGRGAAGARTGVYLDGGVSASVGADVGDGSIQPQTLYTRASVGVSSNVAGTITDAAMGMSGPSAIISAPGGVLHGSAGSSEAGTPLCGAAVTTPGLRVRVRYTPLQAAAYLCPRRKCYVYRPVCARHVTQAEDQRAVVREARRRAWADERERLAKEQERTKAASRGRRRRGKGWGAQAKASGEEETRTPSGAEGVDSVTQGGGIAADGRGRAGARDTGQASHEEQDGTSKRRKRHRLHAAAATLQEGSQAVSAHRRGRPRKAQGPQEGGLSQGSAEHTHQGRQARTTRGGDVGRNVGGAEVAVVAEAAVTDGVGGSHTHAGERTEEGSGGGTDQEDLYVCIGEWDGASAPWLVNDNATHWSEYDATADEGRGGGDTNRSTPSTNASAVASNMPSEMPHSDLPAVQRDSVDISRPALAPIGPLTCVPCVARGSTGQRSELSKRGISVFTVSASDTNHRGTSRTIRAETGLDETELRQNIRCHTRAASVSLPPRTHARTKALARVLSVLATLLHAHGQEGHSSKRDLYYANTSLFGTQRASDASLLLVQSLLHAPRHALGVSAGGRGECEGDVVVEVRECLRVWRETEVNVGDVNNPLLNRGITAVTETSSDRLLGVGETCMDVLRLCQRAGWSTTCTAAEREDAVTHTRASYDYPTGTRIDASSAPHDSTSEGHQATASASTRYDAIAASPVDSQQPHAIALSMTETLPQSALREGACACICTGVPTRIRECLFEHHTPAGSFDFAFARHIPDINAQRHLRPAARAEVVEYVGAAALASDGDGAASEPLPVHATQHFGQQRTVHTQGDGEHAASTGEQQHTDMRQRAYVRVCGYYLEHAIEHRVRCRAQWVLVVEKDTVFRQLVGSTASNYLPQNTAAEALQDSDIHRKGHIHPKMTFSQRYGCLVVTGGGYPGVQTRQFLRELAIGGTKIVCLVDGDPHGIAICLAYLFGSPNQCLDCPAHLPLRWIGVTPRELWRNDDRVSAHIRWGEKAGERARSGASNARGAAPRIVGAGSVHLAAHDDEEDSDDEDNNDTSNPGSHNHNRRNIPNTECPPQPDSLPPQRPHSELDVSVRRQLCLPLSLRDRRTARELLRWLDKGERRGLDAVMGAGSDADEGADGGDGGGEGSDADADEEEEDFDGNEDNDGAREDAVEDGGSDESSRGRGPRHWSRTAAKLASELKYMLRHNCKCEIEAVSALGSHALERYVVSKAGRFVKDLRIPDYHR